MLSVVIFSILSSENSIGFQDKTLNKMLMKNQKYFLYEKYIRLFCNVS